MMKQSKRDETASQQPWDFAAMLHSLSCQAAFPFPLPDDGSISVIQTHASAVLLTPMLIYKLKKPKNFGFFDYSTPALRRHFCIQETYLNARLAPGIYLGVAPVLHSPDGRFRFGLTLPADAVPEPGTELEGSVVVDYAVVMVRLPDEAMLEARVDEGKATPELLTEIGRFIATFHDSARMDGHIAGFGKLAVIQGNWEENFVQMRPYIGRTIDQETYDGIVTSVRRFIQAREVLFEQRIRTGHIRDCHGDLRLQHVYLLDTLPEGSSTPPLPRLAVLDSIEFNERFRYGDVASEVAFLAMELDAAGRNDLARTFVDAYVMATDDETLRELLPFYCCYRACVRGKVLSFLLDEPEVSEQQREAAREAAGVLFALAASYASGPTRPVLMMVGGVMGTGKSTLAQALHRELGWTLYASDALRKRLARLDPLQPQANAFGQGIYNAQWTARTYQALQMQARASLATGRSVVLDASFIHRSDRQALAHEASMHGASVMFVECRCPREVVLRRLAQRWRGRIRGEPLAQTPSFASDGRPALYDAQCSAYDAFDASEERGCGYIVASTVQPLSMSVEHVLEMLRVPRFICSFPRTGSIATRARKPYETVRAHVGQS